MSAKRYFQAEYNYLEKAGNEFADRYDDLAHELRIKDRRQRDPFVERLLESFAFLAGRIHERLDDDFPEITGGLLELLCPQLLRPFPACAILQAKFKSKATESVLIQRGSLVATERFGIKAKRSKPAPERSRYAEEDNAHRFEEEEHDEFIFRTTQDLWVRPMQLRNVQIVEAANAASALIFEIHPESNVTLEKLDLRRLSIYLSGPEPLRKTLQLYLTQYVQSLAVREATGADVEFQEITPFKIGIVGLSPEFDQEADDNRALLPGVNTTFNGFRLLQEYFAFPNRFFFIDLDGLQGFKKALRPGQPLQVKVTFAENRKLPWERRPEDTNLLLHCTPVINLFEQFTEPVEVNQRLPEYYLIPDSKHQHSREIYAVDKVESLGDKLYKYVPAASYEVLDTTAPNYDYKRFYSLRRSPPGADGDYLARTYIRLFGKSMETEELAKEKLSICATMSNGTLPVAYIKQPGQIKIPIKPEDPSDKRFIPPGIDVANLDLPTEALQRFEPQNYLWALISHLTINLTSLAEAGTLQSLLSLYNWTNAAKDKTNHNRIEAIKKVYRPEIKYLPYQRSFVRGVEFKIDVDLGGFGDEEGDLHLFGLVLNRFLAQYATINSVVCLTIKDVKNNKTYTWEPNLGRILPI